jgi:hypothetical protein
MWSSYKVTKEVIIIEHHCSPQRSLFVTAGDHTLRTTSFFRCQLCQRMSPFLEYYLLTLRTDTSISFWRVQLRDCQKDHQIKLPCECSSVQTSPLYSSVLIIPAGGSETLLVAAGSKSSYIQLKFKVDSSEPVTIIRRFISYNVPIR